MEREEILGGKPIKCKPGQFTTGRKQLSEETGISESKIERILSNFEKIEQQIEQQKTSVNRLISILNWQDYQSIEQQIEQQVNSDRTTSGQRVNTLKELKNDKNVKNERMGSENFDFSDEKIQTPTSRVSENPDEKPENPKPPKTPSEKIDYLKLAEYWNTTTKFAKVTTMSDTRKKSINARFKEHGKHVIQQVIDKAAESKFLNGDNDKNWTANFDWIFKPTNFVKILEGNYDNRNKKKPSITDIWPELKGKEGIE